MCGENNGICVGGNFLKVFSSAEFCSVIQKEVLIIEFVFKYLFHKYWFFVMYSCVIVINF